MSRASDVRDGIVAELQTDFPDNTVSAFIIPRWTREDLTAGPQIGVRVGSRDLLLNQGPDEKQIGIEIGVVGITPDTTEATTEVAKVDEYDALLESIIALYMNGGRLSRGGIADHFPVAIEQSVQFDPDQLRQGVYLSLITVTYQDTED